MTTDKASVSRSRAVFQLLASTAVVVLAGCGSYGGNTQPVSVQISPKTVSVKTGQTQQFTATVLYATNTAVTWQVNGATGGDAAHGTISTTGLYTPPAAPPNPATVTVSAVSQADSTKSDSASVTVTDGTAPTAPSSLTANAAGSQISLAWTASTDNVGVTQYQIQRCSGAACSPSTQAGTSNTNSFQDTGLAGSTSYSYRVSASDAAGNVSGFSNTATAITGASVVAVTITPVRGGLAVTQKLSLTPTVTGDSTNSGVSWSFTSTGSSTGGSFSSANSASGTPVTFTAPSGAGVATITAKSVADVSKSASATIGVTDLAGVFTYHNDNSRTGANTQEYALTTSNLTTSTFGKLFSCTVDAAIYAQPLWVANLSISGVNHNVVYVETQHNSVYAFDADNSTCTNVWGGAKNLNGTNETWVTSVDVSCSDLAPDIGIVGTPVIDPVSSTIYVVTKSKNTSVTPNTYHQRLHALDLATGSEKTGSPVEIQAQVNGTGGGSVSGKLSFDPLINNERSALLLSNDSNGRHVIISWASHCDNGQYHGWVMSYGAGTLSPEAVFNVSPNGALGGVWMSGSGPAADTSGNIFFATGNGSWTGTDAFGDSIVKLGPPSGGNFGALDYFTPTNQLDLSNADRDLGSGGVLLLPNLSSGTHTQLLVQVGKEGKIYLADRQNLGQIFCTTSTLGNPCSTTDPQLVQELPGATGGMWGSPAFWNNNVYFGGSGDDLKAFSFNQAGTGLLSNTWTSRTPTGFAFPGTTPSVSSHPSITGTSIVWALDTANNGTDGSGFGPAVLHAYDAASLATELWTSSKVSSDAAGTAVKFTVPTVANGKVYVGEQGTLSVYGLKP